MLIWSIQQLVNDPTPVAQLTGADASIADLERDIKRLQAELAAEGTRAAGLEDDVAAREANIGTLHAQIEALTASGGKVEGMLEEKVKAAMALGKELDETRQAVADLEGVKADLTSRIHALVRRCCCFWCCCWWWQ